MNFDLFAILLGGAIRDPILWIIGGICGWDIEQRLKRAICFFVVAGGIWGGIRVAIYLSFGEELSASGVLGLVTVCVGLMVGVGLSVRICRVFYVKYNER